jgi:hypothetical protein
MTDINKEDKLAKDKYRHPSSPDTWTASLIDFIIVRGKESFSWHNTRMHLAEPLSYRLHMCNGEVRRRGTLGLLWKKIAPEQHVSMLKRDHKAQLNHMQHVDKALNTSVRLTVDISGGGVGPTKALATVEGDLLRLTTGPCDEHRRLKHQD